MSLDQLQQLAEHGLAAVPRLDDVAVACWEHGENTGDARYCVLWRSLQVISGAYGDRPEDVHFEGLASSVVSRLDGVITRELPAVLSAEDPEHGTAIAVTMARAIDAVFREAGDPRRPRWEQP